MKKVFRIGTRSSQLALWQANWVGAQLKQQYPHATVELIEMSTLGDRMLSQPLSEIGGKGLFTQELEEAMLRGTIDMAVHSLKDMPTDLPEGLVIGAITKRESPFDVLVSGRYKNLASLPRGATVGTSSLRRKAQLLRLRPDLQICTLRGNINTRLKKGLAELDAIVLAQAGLVRLGFDEHIGEVFSVHDMVPAVGQGALAVECCHTEEMMMLLSALDHRETHQAVEGERSFLRTLNGGCQVPMGVYGVCLGDELTLQGRILSLNGQQSFEGKITVNLEDAHEGGVKLAETLCQDGAQVLVDQFLERGIWP